MVQWVDCIIDTPAESAGRARSFWAAAIGWEIGEPWPDHPEFVSLEPPTGPSHVHVQVIDGPARVHVDLSVPDIDVEAQRHVALGATTGTRAEEWQVMASPGGLPYCLIRESRQVTRATATRWPDGHATSLIQVCIDSPEALHDREVAFWVELTGWELRASDSPEFGGKIYPSDGPLHFLFQRLGPEDKATHTRAHIDLASDDVPGDVTRLTELGASLIGPGDGWVALRDPNGMPFCLTEQSPG